MLTGVSRRVTRYGEFQVTAVRPILAQNEGIGKPTFWISFNPASPYLKVLFSIPSPRLLILPFSRERGKNVVTLTSGLGARRFSDARHSRWTSAVGEAAAKLESTRRDKVERRMVVAWGAKCDLVSNAAG